MKIGKDDIEKIRSTKICGMMNFLKKKIGFFYFIEDDEG